MGAGVEEEENRPEGAGTEETEESGKIRETVNITRVTV
ncbi:hypothetical protein TIFTF001_056212 [Ficus carica]|uniref:Uncharacterized protein n=1 Tax=Ficus carica TaxID=3494 RepID=A0AA88JJ00_FICCA|nr:hypothetical protein TIFTF001_056212 [Ficus carica]